ncbi:hypothetical protein [Halomonas stenophila]|uniref:Uncharacterized protein n=1 Tax=Halomonas stenophila TaxID=795312 RepID=A0A7W5EVF0_9GAMM|nr:hypothetical protein [Halomonas stenophila]MBB3231065.1 hypothetical protein [Halomonas stenophila]
MPRSTELPTEYSHDWLERLDGRTRLAQAVRQRYTALTTDLGGHENLSYQRRSLAKRAVWMEATIEQAEAALARGDEVDHGAITQKINSLLGLYKTLGLDRVAQPVESIKDILDKHKAAQ